jgi:hypothetical protein
MGCRRRRRRMLFSWPPPPTVIMAGKTAAVTTDGQGGQKWDNFRILLIKEPILLLEAVKPCYI